MLQFHGVIVSFGYQQYIRGTFYYANSTGYRLEGFAGYYRRVITAPGVPPLPAIYYIIKARDIWMEDVYVSPPWSLASNVNIPNTNCERYKG